MNITVKLDKNKWTLYVKGQHNGVNIRKKIRSKKNIDLFVDSLGTPDKMFMGIEDLKLVYDGCDVILKNYRKYNNRFLYMKIMKKINANVDVTDVTYTNIEKIGYLAKKLLLNRNSIIALAAISVIGGVKLSQPNTDSVPETFAVVEGLNDILEATPEFYFEEEEAAFDVESYLSLDNRINEIENIQYNEQNSSFNICSNLDEYALNKLVKYYEEYGHIYMNASKKYGVDPYLLLSLAMTETSLLHENTIPGGCNYNGSAVGVMQIERVHIGSEVTAYNYELGEYETVKITEDKLIDLETNVEIGAMMFQNNLEKYNNNVYIAIQAHNYGEQTMDLIINAYSKETGKTFEEITLDYGDLGWLKYVDDVHNNPHKYLSNWSYNTYGNNNYIYSVMGYYMGQNVVNNTQDSYYVYDLTNDTCTKENNNSIEHEQVRTK